MKFKSKILTLGLILGLSCSCYYVFSMNRTDLSVYAELSDHEKGIIDDLRQFCDVNLRKFVKFLDASDEATDRNIEDDLNVLKGFISKFNDAEPACSRDLSLEYHKIVKDLFFKVLSKALEVIGIDSFDETKLENYFEYSSKKEIYFLNSVFNFLKEKFPVFENFLTNNLKLSYDGSSPGLNEHEKYKSSNEAKNKIFRSIKVYLSNLYSFFDIYKQIRLNINEIEKREAPTVAAASEAGSVGLVYSAGGDPSVVKNDVFKVEAGTSVNDYIERIRELAYSVSDYLQATIKMLSSGNNDSIYNQQSSVFEKYGLNNSDLLGKILECINNCSNLIGNDENSRRSFISSLEGIILNIMNDFERLCETVVRTRTTGYNEVKNTVLPNLAGSLVFVLSAFDSLSVSSAGGYLLDKYGALLNAAHTDINMLAERSYVSSADPFLTGVVPQEQKGQQQSLEGKVYGLLNSLMTPSPNLNKSLIDALMGYVMQNNFDSYGLYDFQTIDTYVTNISQILTELKATYDLWVEKEQTSTRFDMLMADLKGVMGPLFDNLRDAEGFFALTFSSNQIGFGELMASIKKKLLDIYSIIYNGQTLTIKEPIAAKIDMVSKNLKSIASSVSKMGMQIFSSQQQKPSKGFFSDFFGSFNYLISQLREVGFTNSRGDINYYDACLDELTILLDKIKNGEFSAELIEEYLPDISNSFSDFFKLDPSYYAHSQFYELVLTKLIPPKVLREREEQIKNVGMSDQDFEKCKTYSVNILQSAKYLLDGKTANVSALRDLFRGLNGLISIFEKYYPENVKGNYADAYAICFATLEDLINMAKDNTGLFSSKSLIDDSTLIELRSLLIDFYKLSVNFENDPLAWYNQPFKSSKVKKDITNSGSVAKAGKKKLNLSKFQLKGLKKIRDQKKKHIKKLKLEKKNFKQSGQKKAVIKKKTSVKKALPKISTEKVKKVSKVKKAAELTPEQKLRQKNAKRARNVIFGNVAQFLNKLQKKLISLGNYKLGDDFSRLVNNLKSNRGKGFKANLKRLKTILNVLDDVCVALEKKKSRSNFLKLSKFLRGQLFPLFMSKKDKENVKLKNKDTGIIKKMLDHYFVDKTGGLSKERLEHILDLKNSFVNEDMPEIFGNLNKIFGIKTVNKKQIDNVKDVVKAKDTLTA